MFNYTIYELLLKQGISKDKAEELATSNFKIGVKKWNTMKHHLKKYLTK